MSRKPPDRQALTLLPPIDLEAKRRAESKAFCATLLGFLNGDYADWIMHGGPLVPDSQKPWLRVIERQRAEDRRPAHLTVVRSPESEG